MHGWGLGMVEIRMWCLRTLYYVSSAFFMMKMESINTLRVTRAFCMYLFLYILVKTFVNTNMCPWVHIALGLY